MFQPNEFIMCIKAPQKTGDGQTSLYTWGLSALMTSQTDMDVNSSKVFLYSSTLIHVVINIGLHDDVHTDTCWSGQMAEFTSLIDSCGYYTQMWSILAFHAYGLKVTAAFFPLAGLWSCLALIRYLCLQLRMLFPHVAKILVQVIHFRTDVFPCIVFLPGSQVIKTLTTMSSFSFSFWSTSA